jgi:hypothetical protein
VARVAFGLILPGQSLAPSGQCDAFCGGWNVLSVGVGSPSPMHSSNARNQPSVCRQFQFRLAAAGGVLPLSVARSTRDRVAILVATVSTLRKFRDVVVWP